MCVKRGTILQTRKSLITVVRGRTGVASPYTQTTRVEILCVKRGIILQTRKSLDAHTDTIFQNLGILKFHDIYLMQLGLFMYSYQNHTLP